MSIINEIKIGEVPKYNGMTMYRKYNSELGFIPNYKFIDDNTLSMESRVIVNYIEYFKNEQDIEIVELRKYKNYIVPNIAATYKEIDIVKSPAVYYQEGEIIQGASFDDLGNETSPSIIANGSEIKIPVLLGKETIVDKPEWLAANNWFMSIARTPVTAPIGIMDGIELTLASLPINIPNGYVLQGQ